MQGATTTYVVDQVDAGGYEPDMIDGTQVGEFHQIGPAGSSESRLDVSLWRSGPGTYDYFFEGDGLESCAVAFIAQSREAD